MKGLSKMLEKTYEGKTWKEWAEELDAKLAELETTSNDEMDAIYLKMEYNEKIRKAWENERIAKNANKSLFDMVGHPVIVNVNDRYWKRTLRWNGCQFYVNLDKHVAIVKYNAIWDNFEVEEWIIKNVK